MGCIGYIFDIKRYAIHDGPGIRTTVFMQGCPLDCWWCHNPESKAIAGNGSQSQESSLVPPHYKSISTEALLKEILLDWIFYEESGGGVTFSGGEPLVQGDFLLQMLQAVKAEHLHTTVDTAGCVEWTDLARIIPYTDLFLYDLKLIDASNHEKYTGRRNDQILSNLKELTRRHGNIQVRIPLIPGITDTITNIEDILDFLEELYFSHEICLLPYNQLAKSKFQRYSITGRLDKLALQTPAELTLFLEKFRSRGFQVRIGG